MNALEHKVLAYFGKLIVSQVRDVAIHQWKRLVDDGLGHRNTEAQALIDKLGPDAKRLLELLIPAVVDTTVHQMMFLLDQGDVYGIQVSVTTHEGEVCPNIAETSDGLVGDVIDWITAFSEEQQERRRGGPC